MTRDALAQLGFEQPALWLAAIPWSLFWLWFGWHQRRARAWIAERVSPRFQPALTAYTPSRLKVHLALLLVMGLLLIAAAAQPVDRGQGEVLSERGRVLLLIDGSASMYAEDVGTWEAKNRFAVARQIAADLVEALPGFEFALASFSGVATFHLPMTADVEVLAEALRTVEPHTFYQNTGSSFSVALDAALSLAEGSDEGFQVVFLSDGEQPFPEAFEEPLAALASLEIPVHALAIGSSEGQSRLIYDFRDVMAKKPTEERRVLRDYTTRRVDEHLERIAGRSGGRFWVATPTAVGLLADTLKQLPQKLRTDQAATELSHLPLALFLVLFLLDQLFFTRRRRADYRFDVERLGDSHAAGRHRARRRGPGRKNGAAGSRGLIAGLLVALGLIASCSERDPTQLAHRANETGIERDGSGLHRAAQRSYRRSLGFQVTPHIPAYNLARSATLEGDFTTAHKLYQDALQLEPRLAEAYYNDGIVLYRWGAAERDPRDCDLERSLDFWRQAERRFETALDLAEPGSELEHDARANRIAVAAGIRELEALIADPPPACRSQSSESESGGGGADGGAEGGGGADDGGGNAGGAGGGGGGDPGSPPSGSESPPQSPPPSTSGGEPPPSGTDPSPPPPPSPDPPPGGSSPDQGAAELSAGEREEIRQALERIAEQRLEEGKFHRRTLPEQFSKEVWENPDAEIWW